mmetsp:Transcript_13983/g.18230  ORF Transcript_13983/g.18230 Transcript_13983/m.18230 type:complete len:199 (+) Transcript_13983:299-895(+)|eukprot:CAMPEP_0198144464 /NCGR_PEP_ID=MMETSP1443-20131203/16104_1 /TAXON_ID=186043 /ORGANISM="Entomoneis sp., Strain CCMP2396" /LENGTH=198 /DNA_ID=CAMNT_0043807867 /DNA_START=244 /DNA_END=840 /DNA_ORIENTATION=-
MTDIESGSENLLVFDRYDEEFNTLTQQIQKSLDEEPMNPYTQNLLQQCQDLLKQMALEARSLKQPKLLQRVKEYKSQHAQLVSQYERQGLLSGHGGDEEDSRRRTEDMLSNQNDSLERARRTMQETEQVALEITEELGQNRETLMSAHGRVKEVSSLTGRARRILNTMTQRALQQKMVVYAVGGGLVLAFMIMLWMMW